MRVILNFSKYFRELQGGLGIRVGDCYCVSCIKASAAGYRMDILPGESAPASHAALLADARTAVTGLHVPQSTEPNPLGDLCA